MSRVTGMFRLRAIAILTLLAVSPLAASETKFFRAASRQDFLPGTFEGVRIDVLGSIRLADRAERLAELAEPFVFAAAVHPEGWVVGTGNSGRVLLIGADGTASEVLAADEPDIFAVAVAPDGTIYAGSSPEGRVYRIRNGQSEVFFDPGETYIWALALTSDGSLLVATGIEGRLYRVDSAGTGRVLHDSDDVHLRSLAVAPSGILVGTAGEGRVLLIDDSGRARTLYDAVQPEVAAFAVAPDGTAYAAVLASEASLIEATPQANGGNGNGNGGNTSGQAGVVVLDENGNALASGRPGGYSGPRSEVLRIATGGRVESAVRLNDETIHALSWERSRLWLGTGLEGRVYSLQDRHLVVEKDVEERQVVSILRHPRFGLGFATTNAAAIYRFIERPERTGTFLAAPFDARQIASFGTMHWTGENVSDGAVKLSFRSGMSSQPDATWSAWTDPREGREVSLADVPAGRYLQWRAEISAKGSGSPALTGVTVSYRQHNVPPVVEALSVLDPGEILVPTNFNPGNQVFEPFHPNQDGIFTSLDTEGTRQEDQRLKTLWKRGYRTLQWQASDPNQDALRYALSFRPEGVPDAWLEVVSDLENDYFSFDSTVLADGVYRFRLTATDRAAGGVEPGMSATETTGPVVVDHSVPVAGRPALDGESLRVTVRDELSPLIVAEYSVDAGKWTPAPAEDGLVDGLRESFVLPVPEDARLILLRVSDAARNMTTFNLLER